MSYADVFVRTSGSRLQCSFTDLRKEAWIVGDELKVGSPCSREGSFWIAESQPVWVGQILLGIVWNGLVWYV